MAAVAILLFLQNGLRPTDWPCAGGSTDVFYLVPNAEGEYWRPGGRHGRGRRRSSLTSLALAWRAGIFSASRSLSIRRESPGGSETRVSFGKSTGTNSSS